MSGLKITETSLALTLGSLRFAVRYRELLLPDGVIVQGPVDVALDGDLLSAQVGSFRLCTA